MASPPAPLTDAEKEFFLEHGYLKLTNCFTREQAAEVCEGVWTRLGMSPTDRSTWAKERTNVCDLPLTLAIPLFLFFFRSRGEVVKGVDSRNKRKRKEFTDFEATQMPSHRTFDVSVFAPKAWSAICELCGGEERVAPESKDWRDSLIVNLGTAEGEGKPKAPRDLPGWHVDGDFFVHYLDSPEQALLVTPLFTDIVSQGGGTVICPPGIDMIANWLYTHPQGVSPWMRPRDSENFRVEKSLDWYRDLLRTVPGAGFVEATGEVGDVYLLHPLMMHSASDNALRRVRIITNPPVSLKEPHCFDREDGNYSLGRLRLESLDAGILVLANSVFSFATVERKTMRSIGEEKLKGWKITAPRERVIPQRVRIQEAMKREEMKRMEGQRKYTVAAA
ncbi:hypothetical protein E0Z10_g8183 [Xylaria hypoxylon]|uniref:Uncharacterized protein n=1 Tax=Xylaria hypoxylon TaxID=37992 RepID=A0A4Z0YC40_9PEZI|nr:hypothetical protein E0Z10_g8183 [Xylaria hypoxylon]